MALSNLNKLLRTCKCGEVFATRRHLIEHVMLQQAAERIGRPEAKSKHGAKMQATCS